MSLAYFNQDGSLNQANMQDLITQIERFQEERRVLESRLNLAYNDNYYLHQEFDSRRGDPEVDHRLNMSDEWLRYAEGTYNYAHEIHKSLAEVYNSIMSSIFPL